MVVIASIRQFESKVAIHVFIFLTSFYNFLYYVYKQFCKIFKSQKTVGTFCRFKAQIFFHCQGFI